MDSSPSDRLTITDRPYFLWIFGLVFLGLGLFLLTNQDGLLGGVIFGGAGLAILVFFGGISVCDVDRTTSTVTLKTTSLLGTKKREILIRDVSDVIIEQSHSSRGGTTFRVSLVTTSGETFPLRSYYSSGYGSKQKTAERLRSFLGVTSNAPYRADGTDMRFRSSRDGVTDGVHWKVEIPNAGPSIVTSWFTGDVQFPSLFLLLAQLPEGQKGAATLSGLMGSLFKMMYPQYLNMFPLESDERPDMNNLSAVDGVDPQLSSRYIIMSNFANGARDVLNPWTVIPLTQWADQHPVHNLQAVGRGQFGPLLVLYTGRGLRLGFSSELDQNQVEEIARFGAELARAQGAAVQK